MGRRVLTRAVLMMIRGNGGARKYVLRVCGRMHVDAGRRGRKLARLMYLMMGYVVRGVGVGWRQKGSRDGRLRVQVGHPRGRQVAQVAEVAQIAQVIRQAGHVVP